MNDEILKCLENVGQILKNCTGQFEKECGAYIEEILKNGIETEIWQYLVSNDLWGGSGSIADQACISSRKDRRKLEKSLIDLGRIQMKIGKVNVRTGSWVDAFDKWRLL